MKVLSGDLTIFRGIRWSTRLPLRLPTFLLVNCLLYTLNIHEATWDHYMEGDPFEVKTNNRSITFFFFSQLHLNKRQARLMAYLTTFDFIIEHIPGKHNIIVDVLSRLPLLEGPHDSTVTSAKPVVDANGFLRDWNVDLEDLYFGEEERPQLAFIPAQVPSSHKRSEVKLYLGDSQPNSQPHKFCCAPIDYMKSEK